MRNVRRPIFCASIALFTASAGAQPLFKDVLKAVQAATKEAPGAQIKNLTPGAKVTITKDQLGKQAPADAVVAVRSGTSPVRLAAAAYRLPVNFGSVVNGAPRVYAPVAILESNGLQYLRSASAFVGTILVGLRDLNNSAASYPIHRPVDLTLAGPFSSVAPEHLSIGHINQPYLPVKVSIYDPAQPAVDVRLYSTLDAKPVEVPLAVHRPPLLLSVSPKRILGFGLEVANVRISGESVPKAKGLGVILANDRGRLRTDRVTLDVAGQGTTTIRSAGIGRATITAKGLPYQDASATVNYTWPWLFLGAILIGGVVGSAVRYRGASGFVKSLVSGCATGTLATVLYTVGVNVFSFTPVATTGEALAFALSGVGAFLGPTLFHHLGRAPLT